MKGWFWEASVIMIFGCIRVHYGAMCECYGALEIIPGVSQGVRRGRWSYVSRSGNISQSFGLIRSYVGA